MEILLLIVFSAGILAMVIMIARLIGLLQKNRDILKFKERMAYLEFAVRYSAVNKRSALFIMEKFNEIDPRIDIDRVKKLRDEFEKRFANLLNNDNSENV